ncbi:MAG: hypothetical protein ABR583_01975 [Gaiellaceae bacterium]
MTDSDPTIAHVLDGLVPHPRGDGDWGTVVRDGRRRLRGRLAAALAPAVALVAVAVGALLWPFGAADRGTVLERALAAVGDEPVLHVVFRGDWGGTVVDLQTGARQPVHAEQEIWYDTDRKLVRAVSRLGGVVESEGVESWKQPAAEYEALLREYRAALRTGTARVAGEDVVDRIPVYWVTWHRELNPDVADGRLHEWQQQVAISRETFKPVAMRETLDGKPARGSGRRVLELETVSTDAADFAHSGGPNLDRMAFRGGQQPIALEEAPGALGRAPYWLGQQHVGLPLAQIAKTITAIGRQNEIELHGEGAAAARECLERRHPDARASGDRPVVRIEACERARGAGRGISMRGGRVYTHGPVVWEPERTGVAFFYGRLGDDPSTYRKDSVPLWDEPHVSVAQTTSRTPSPWHRAPGYVPPKGSLLLTAPRNGFLERDGVYVTIEASSEQMLLAAARALEPMLVR